MIDSGTMNTTTEQPASHEGSGGFPPFDTTTFPSQIFWLVVTFAFLFVVVWRVAGPRINGVITVRRNKINGDIAEAQKHRGDAEAASAAYQTALAQLAAGSRAAAALRRFEWTLLRETGYGVDAEMPDFEDPAVEPALRRDLRERLAQNLAGRELAAVEVVPPELVEGLAGTRQRHDARTCGHDGAARECGGGKCHGEWREAAPRSRWVFVATHVCGCRRRRHARAANESSKGHGVSPDQFDAGCAGTSRHPAGHVFTYG